MITLKLTLAINQLIMIVAFLTLGIETRFTIRLIITITNTLIISKKVTLLTNRTKQMISMITFETISNSQTLLRH